MKNCTQCAGTFEVTDHDRAFYDKVSPVLNGKKYAVPEPALCPDCRQQRRLAFYNRRRLYKRNCDYSNKSIVSIFSPDKPFKVYDKEVWFSDKWDPLEYGRDFDFSRPFFEQYREFMGSVPLLSLMLLGDNINSDFNNDNMGLKNCYLTFDGGKGEDSYYGESFVEVKNSTDFLFLEHSELCYECTNSKKCYNVKYSRFCNNCSDSWFLRDCTGCKHCFGCVNLNQKEYYIFNKPHTKEEYKAFMDKFDSGNHAAVEKMQKEIEAFYLTKPVRAIHGVHNENVIGDNLNYCKNSFYCFDSNFLQDCEYMNDSQTGAKDTWDVDVWGEGMELCYESCVAGANVRNVMWCYCVSEGADSVYYSTFCSRSVHHLFGCVGLRHKEYHIFNKPYSPKQWSEMVAKIIEHMQKTGEWGQYFPPQFSPFGYNETVAQDHFPLDKKEVLKRGWQWKDEPEKLPDVTRVIPADRLPDNIKEIPDDILNWAIKCESTGRPFRLIPQELKFYRDHDLPVPHFHPDERHHRRMALRNPHHLWDRTCAKCNQAIKTTYSPERPEIVYCEQCYLKEVY